MRLVTTEKIYIGRLNMNAVKSNTPDAEFGYCNPLRRKDGTPLFIPENTEIVKIGSLEEFSTYAEFEQSLEEGMFDFIISDDDLRDEVANATEYANIPFLTEDEVRIA